MLRLSLGLAGLTLLAVACSGGATPPPGPFDSGPGDNPESCNDGLDDDRDGRVDEGCECSPGAEQRCFRGDPALAGEGACVYGSQRCLSSMEFDGEWDVCEGDGFPGTDLCNALDDDCDGTVDEGCACVDGETRDCYDGPADTEGVGVCAGGTATCVGLGDGTEWSGCEGQVLPGDEVCDNGADDDCDGTIDEGCSCSVGATLECFGGPAGAAGRGECRAGSQTCVMTASGSEWGTCTGEVLPRTEVCTGGMDEDCDGMTDCDDPECAASCCEGFGETLAVVPAEGEILFVVDRSGSMDWAASGTTRTRWQELDTAMTSVVPMLSSLPAGLYTFPEVTGDSEVGNCMVASGPDVAIATGTGSAILSALVAADPRAGDTPTPQAFSTAESIFSARPAGRERFVILATDGLPEPACGSTVPATVTAISDIRSREGVDTFVIGIVGPDPSGDTSGIPALRDGLNMMADAGGRPRTGSSTRYYEAVDAASLTSALRAAIADATDCRFELSSAPPDPSAVEVRLDSTVVPSASYTLTGTSLTVEDFYCDRIRAGLVMSVSVADTCGP